MHFHGLRPEERRDERASRRFDLQSRTTSRTHGLRQLLRKKLAVYRSNIDCPVLRYLEGNRPPGTATIVGCPAGTVLSRLAWARRRLQLRLLQAGWDWLWSFRRRLCRRRAIACPVRASDGFSGGGVYVHESGKTGRSVLLAGNITRHVGQIDRGHGCFHQVHHGGCRHRLAVLPKPERRSILAAGNANFNWPIGTPSCQTKRTSPATRTRRRRRAQNQHCRR